MSLKIFSAAAAISDSDMVTLSLPVSCFATLGM